MPTDAFYIVRWIITDGERYLLWRDGGPGPDEYALMRGSSKILTARSADKLVQAADRNGWTVHGAEAQVIDFQIVRSVLRSLRPGRPLSERSARFLLEAWNALDDLSHSLGCAFITSRISQREETKSVYDKLFYGNNLPAVTPGGSTCQPLLSDHQRAVLRSLLRNGISRAEHYLT